MNTLPIHIAGALTLPEAYRDEEISRIKRETPPRRIDPHSPEGKDMAANRLERAIAQLASAKESERHDTLLKKASYLYGMIAGGWLLDPADVERGLFAAMAQNGGLTKYGEREIQRCINDARNHAPVIPVETAEKPRKAKKASRPLDEQISTFNLPSFTASQMIDAEFVTEVLTPADLLAHRTVAIKSGTGTAKTTLVGQLCDQLPDDVTFLAIAPTVLLTESMANTLKLAHYRDPALQSKKLWSAAPQLACSVNSLHYLAGRWFDVLFIDEAEQVFEYLNNTQTFRGGEAATAYDTLRDLITRTGIVIVADANLTDKSPAILEGIRGHKPHAIENIHRRSRGDVIFLSDPYYAIHVAERLIEDDKGPVLIPSATERLGSEVHRYLSGLYGEDAGLLISRDTSETRKVKDFIRNINTELPRYRWLMHTSSMGSGVDIKKEAGVYAVVGLFPPQPLSPGNVVQMMGRARHARHRYLYISGGDGHHETNAQVLFARRRHNARATAERARFDDYGIAPWDKTTLALLRMEAEFSAQQNRERNQFKAATAERLRRDGFTIRTDETQHEALRPLFQALRITIEDERRELALSVAPVTHEQMDAYRRREMEITPAIRAGFLRWKIEDTVGQGITPVLYGDFKSKTARKALSRGANLFEVAEALAEADRDEAVERVPLHRRSNRSESAALFERTLERAGFKKLDELKEYLSEDHSEDEINTRFAHLQEAEVMADFRRLLGYQPGRHTSSITGKLRYFLRAYGLKLSSQKRMVEGKRGQWYFVLQDDYATWLDRIQSRLEHIRRRATVQNLKFNALQNEVLDTRDYQEEVEKAAVPQPSRRSSAHSSNPYSEPAHRDRALHCI